MGLVKDILLGIWDNFNSAEGKIIVGALIDFIMLWMIVSHIQVKDFKGALRPAGIALVSSVIFALWSTVHADSPGLFNAFKILVVSAGVVFAGVMVFALLGPLFDHLATPSAPRRDNTIYDGYGNPIELRQVDGHYEDTRYHDHYEVHGNRAEAQSMWMTTEDGESVQVTPQGGGYYTSYGHSYHVNSSGRLEED